MSELTGITTAFYACISDSEAATVTLLLASCWKKRSCSCRTVCVFSLPLSTLARCESLTAASKYDCELNTYSEKLKKSYLAVSSFITLVLHVFGESLRQHSFSADRKFSVYCLKIV